MELILFLIAAVVITIYLPKIKGKIGEHTVSLFLNQLDKDKYLILNDVYIPIQNGKTSQIDHVVVSSYGIFVIETKNYKGWITGNENSQYWTQTIYKNKNRLYNPIKQNQGHIRALKELLKDYSDIEYISIIAFSTRVNLKVNTTANVVYIPKILKIIRGYTEEKINEKDVKNIYDLIVSSNIQDKKIKKEHVKTIRKDVAARETKIKENICPWCGGQLVERNGKYGKFTGCSNFPKCRFVLKKQ